MTSTLNEIWRTRREKTRLTQPPNRTSTKDAIKQLYRAISRPEPNIIWIPSPHSIDGRTISDRPPLTGLVDLLAISSWYKSPYPETLAALLAYDQDTASFKMKNNYNIAFSDLRLRRTRTTRPHWLRERSNFITQFDAPTIAFWQFNNQTPSNNMVYNIGNAVAALLDETFGVITFKNLCFVIDRPNEIAFDDADLLSSTTSHALLWRDGTKKYVVNGLVISNYALGYLNNFRAANPRDWRRDTPQLWWYLTMLRRAPERVALIELLGWETFFEIIPKDMMRLVSRDQKYGELWNVTCGNQTLMLLQVTNHSPEPDGTYKKFIIPVDPWLRPLPNPRDPKAKMGDPQSLTALNAVASTFGMTGQRYAEVLGEQA